MRCCDMRMKENKIMKMISRRDFMKASAVVGAAGVLTACGGSSSSTAASSTAASSAAASEAATGSANVGVCIYQFADNFMTLYRTDLEEYLKDKGYAVTIVDGKNDQNTQTEQINTFLQQGVDVLIINPVQTTSAQTIVDTIKPSETPIVFINREPEKAVLDSYAGKCCYVGADARQSGTYQGELILETETQGDINGDGKITYIMCKGDPENIDAQYRTEYSIKALTDAGKEVECLYEYLDNWDQTTAQQDVANALAQYGEKIEVVFCNNDAMALGALQSIEQAGRTVGKDIYLVGVDALKEAVQNVVDGKITYIMCKGDPENIDAQYRTEYSIKALTDAGKEVECLYEYLDNWDQTTAQQDVANALAQYGEKIEVVFCNNDAMALGALQSLQQAGRTVGKDVYLVGVDALSEAVQNVVDGNMTGTVLNDDVGQATAAAAATKLYVEGSKVEQYYWVDYVKVTKENAAQYIK